MMSQSCPVHALDDSGQGVCQSVAWSARGTEVTRWGPVSVARYGSALSADAALELGLEFFSSTHAFCLLLHLGNDDCMFWKRGI